MIRVTQEYVIIFGMCLAKHNIIDNDATWSKQMLSQYPASTSSGKPSTGRVFFPLNHWCEDHRRYSKHQNRKVKSYWFRVFLFCTWLLACTLKQYPFANNKLRKPRDGGARLSKPRPSARNSWSDPGKEGLITQAECCSGDRMGRYN